MNSRLTTTSISSLPRRFLLSGVLILTALLAGFFLGWVLPRFLPFPQSGRVISSSSVVRQVQTLSQLVTVKYVMEKVIILEDVKWFGENRLLLLAHGEVKAGINLAELKPEDVTISGKRIELRLPREQIFDAFLNDAKTEIIERSTGLLRQFDKDLEQNARRQAVDAIRRAARVSGILNDAREKARMQLEVLLRQQGFEEIRFVE